MAILQEDLRRKAVSFRSALYESTQFSRLASKKRSAFLCHSHKDENLVLGMLVLLEEEGIELYVDWKDHAMPEITDKTTASKIQQKIRERDIFLFLATGNSKASRWCPWEIGYADASNRQIYIIPTSDNFTTYGNEYLGLYDHIDHGTAGEKKALALYQPKAEKGRWAKGTL
jgi:hypothetical protein